MTERIGALTVDVRGFDPELRRAMVFAIVDQMVGLGARDRLILVCDHEPVGLGYQVDLRRETRGRFAFECDQRADGTWVAFFTPIIESPES